MTRSVDAVFLERACELAARALGGTSPNPPVGAVLVKDGHIIGEGFHHGSGSPHAEIEALRAARDPHGASLYVSLEPCIHTGRTPPCVPAIVEANIARVVVGALDPNVQTDGGGLRALQQAGVMTELFPSSRARCLIEPFSIAIRSDRPYLALKMASSLDGYVAPKPGSYWLTGDPARIFVRDLRIMHDAVMIGARTVRIDDPQLTVRPGRRRQAPYRRIVVCEREPVSAQSRIFTRLPGYDKTIVIAPIAAGKRFCSLDEIADVVTVGNAADERLDLAQALRELKKRGISSILCEGGPTLCARLIDGNLVDRLYWLLAPTFLANPSAIAALAPQTATKGARSLFFDGVEQLGNDVLLRARLTDV